MGCGLDTPSNNEHDKESDMFFKAKKENYVIFSPLAGVLLKNGEPLSNTKIIRKLRWNDNEEGLVEEFLTDDKGYFSLPIHEEELSLNTLSQFVAKTELEVEIDSVNYELWYNTKFEPELHSETDGPVDNLLCDLALEEITVRAGVSKISTKCRWKNMPESEL